jgi:DNA-binding MarR family transcriptional regulator
MLWIHDTDAKQLRYARSLGKVAGRIETGKTTRMSVELRPAQALSLWHDVGLSLVRGEKIDLTSRQIVVLLTIYLETPPHTVRGLAQKLGVTKPVITRALNAMGDLDLVSRRRDPLDRRNVIIQRTVTGALFLEKLSDLIVKSGRALAR